MNNPELETNKTWLITEDESGALIIRRCMAGVADSEGPTLYTPDDVEAFMVDLRAAATASFGHQR